MSRNRYEKVRLLGAGSFGEAWLVRSVESQRQYVVKEMRMQPNLNQQVRPSQSFVNFSKSSPGNRRVSL